MNDQLEGSLQGGLAQYSLKVQPSPGQSVRSTSSFPVKLAVTIQRKFNEKVSYLFIFLIRGRRKMQASSFHW